MPTAAKRICSHPGCGMLTSTGRCDKHQRQDKQKSGWKSNSERGTSHERGYGAKWRKKRLHVLRRDNYLCQLCIRQNKLTAATDVDHIVSKSAGGSENESNLQSLCRKCHKIKTAKERHNKKITLYAL